MYVFLDFFVGAEKPFSSVENSHVAITTLKVYMFSSCYLTLGGRDPGFLHPTKGLNKSDPCCHRQTAGSTRGARSSIEIVFFYRELSPKGN